MKKMMLVFALLTVATGLVQAKEKSACERLGEKNAPTSGKYFELLTVKCDKEIEAAKENPAPKAPSCSSEDEAVCKGRRHLADRLPEVGATPYAVGEAAWNGAVTRATYRNDQGRAEEFSPAWAKHAEDMAKIQASVAKTEAKASQPKIVSPCGWLGCYTPVGYGYASGVVIDDPFYRNNVGVNYTYHTR